MPATSGAVRQISRWQRVRRASAGALALSVTAGVLAAAPSAAGPLERLGAGSSTALRLSGGPDVVLRVPRLPGLTELGGGKGPSAVRITRPGVYTGTFKARSTGVSAPMAATLSWYDGTGKEMTDERVTGPMVSDSTDAWTPYRVDGLTPRGAVWVTLGVTTGSSTPSAQHSFSSSSLSHRPQGSPPLKGPLRTQGNKILDADGKQVTLRGLNRPGHWTTATPGGFTDHDIARMKAWGANNVRLTLGQQVWLPGCSSYDPAYPAAIDAAVRSITSRGMLAVLDLHFSAPTCTSASTNPLPDERSLLFWQQVATRYRNHPLVAFDLYNEPREISDEVWRDGGPVRSRSGERYQGVGMQRLFSTVRATGADNLVLVAGPETATRWPTTAPLVGTNAVYVVHAYNCIEPWKCKGTDISWLLSKWVEPGRSVPVMVSEFGYPSSVSANGASFNAGVIQFAEQQGWSWSAWAWTVDGGCEARIYFMLLADGTCDSQAGTYQPSPAGMPVLAGFGKNR